MKLSEHFTLEEATASDTAERYNLNNTPPLQVIERMKAVAVHMEMIRSIINKPINISSWYRSPGVNRKVGSSDHSQHIQGEAVDFRSTAYGTPLDICRSIIINQESIPFDQLILEHSWIHISFAIRSGKPRGQVLSLLHNNRYAKGLTNKQGVLYPTTNL